MSFDLAIIGGGASGLSAAIEAKRESKMPITLFWNYDYKAQPIAGQYNDRGTGIEYSWNASWTKGRKYLECIKAYNDETEAIAKQ